MLSIPRLTRLAELSLRFGRVDRATFHPDGRTPESDTDHTHILSLVCMELRAMRFKWADLGYMLSLIQVHDLVEAYTGDESTLGLASATDKAARRAAKSAREAQAIAQMRVDFEEAPWLLKLIDAYEAQDTLEARLVKYVDKILPKLTHALNQGAAVKRAGLSLEELQADHLAQGQELRATYPELADVLGPIFEMAGAVSVEAYRQGLEAGGPGQASEIPAQDPQGALIAWLQDRAGGYLIQAERAANRTDALCFMAKMQECLAIVDRLQAFWGQAEGGSNGR